MPLPEIVGTIVKDTSKAIAEDVSSAVQHIPGVRGDERPLTVQMEHKILRELKAHHVEVKDVSDGSCDGAKLEIIVVAEKFNGQTRLNRHRLVNEAITLFRPKIHAVTMTTYTPDQYKDAGFALPSPPVSPSGRVKEKLQFWKGSNKSPTRSPKPH